MNFASLSSEDRLLLDHVDDMRRIASEQYIPRFSSFLDERQAELARRALRSAGWEDFTFSGGYEGASRVVLGVFPPYTDPQEQALPIVALTARFRPEDTLSHRDFLGSLMGLQIKREAVGDLLVGKGVAVLYLLPPVAQAVERELTKVGRVGVKLSQGAPEQLPLEEAFREIGGTVSSLRLDSLVALLTNQSREKAAALIRGGQVTLDFTVCQETDKPYEQGSRVSIRGFGKYVVETVGGVSKKGRTHLICKKYQ